MRIAGFASFALAIAACSASPSGSAPVAPEAAKGAATADGIAQSKHAIAVELDEWHAAATIADETKYFDHFAPDGVFLGTDATERWTVPQFREYAHPFFAKGKAWSFRSIRRDIVISPSGAMAWFDEDLATPNLGPARGTGVVVRAGDRWKIAHYSLTITVPNERMKNVKDLLSSAGQPIVATGVIGGSIHLQNAPLESTVRSQGALCGDRRVAHRVVYQRDGHLAEVVVRLEPGGVRGIFPGRPPAVIVQRNCEFEPHVVAVMTGQPIAIVNADLTLHNVHAYKNGASWFNQAEPIGADAIVKTIDEPSIVTLTSDLRPWMRGFVVATDHPFFAITGIDGTFRIEGIPPGKYGVEAWHPRYGLKQTMVEITGAKPVMIYFEYAGSEPAPAESHDEIGGAVPESEASNRPSNDSSQPRH